MWEKVGGGGGGGREGRGGGGGGAGRMLSQEKVSISRVNDI